MATTAEGLQALPADLFHLLSVELSERSDFATLFNCVVSSKQLANAGAINALYRISHNAPVKGGNQDLPPAEQELIVQRWSILWRTLTLSALGKTVYPYCRHLRYLDLRDLGHLLEDDRFRGQIAKHFFKDDLAEFHIMQTFGKGRASRLDVRKISTALGNIITQEAPLLESLSEPTHSDILSTALLDWAPRLANLRSLDLWDGKALANETTRNLLHAHCPNLSNLRIYSSPNEDADHHIASFIGGMQENTLSSFENFSNCNIGSETCLALNSHGKSLQTLKLGLLGEGVHALSLLQGCTAVQTLSLEALSSSTDLKASQNDIFLEIVEWLKNCNSLVDISLDKFISAPDLLLPVLMNKDVSLEKLRINANEGSMYVVNAHHDFHEALSLQKGLRSLVLWADPEPVTRDDLDILMNAFCSLKDLRELNLTKIADYFSDEHIKLIAQQLPNLEDLYIGGYGISDAVWPDLATLKNLKMANLSGITTFTEAGILDFLDQLGEGNNGLVLSVDNADPEAAISPESQDLIREVMATKLDGRFVYEPLRDPGMLEFDSDDSD